jgi:hypothetical protein
MTLSMSFADAFYRTADELRAIPNLGGYFALLPTVDVSDHLSDPQ